MARKGTSTKIIPGDTMMKIKPKDIQRAPGRKAMVKTRTSGTSAMRATKRLEKRLMANKALAMKRSGFSFQKIADALGYKSQQMAWYAVQQLLKQTARLSYEDMIQLHVERTENFLMRMETKIQKGDARAIEVAVKVLDRQSELLGLDYIDRKDQGRSLAPIQINILADPRDPDAQRYIAEIAARTGPVIESDVQRPLLPPAEGDPL